MAGKKGRSGRKPKPKPTQDEQEALTFKTDPIYRVLQDIWAGKYTDCPDDGAVAFINCLAHSAGKRGATFQLRDWQEAYVRQLLGTRRPDGLRQYRKSFYFIARKNGKTELCAALCLYFLLADDERGAEVYAAASKKEQSGRIYKAMMAMRNASPYLKALTDFNRGQKRIEVIAGPMEGNIFEALSADEDGALGLNPSCVIFDEVLVGSEALWDALATGQGSRAQPMFIAITTAGPYDPNSLVYREYKYAKAVLAGEIDAPSYLPVIYEVPPDADWKDPVGWTLGNPALGDFLFLDDMADECAKAQHMPSKQNVFRMLRLNQFVESSTRWLSADVWETCRKAFTRASLKGRRCWIGLDLSTVSDLTALVLVFDAGSDIEVLPFLFTPQGKLQEHAEKYKKPYLDWVRDGHLIATPGNTVNYAFIRALINELAKEFDIHSITYDRWNSSHIISELQADGFTCQPIGQGTASMNAPMKLVEKMVEDGSLHHDGNPVLTWNVACVVQTMDSTGNVKPDRQKSNLGGKIDGLVALLNAVDTYSRTVSTGSFHFSFV